MKITISIFTFLICLATSCQTTKNVTYKSIRPQLVDFLIQTGDIRQKEIEDFRTEKYGFFFVGVFQGKDYREGILNDGMYAFSLARTHTRSYFLILEQDKVTILDLSTREGLDVSIKNTLDFCERQKYCSDITNECVSRLVSMFYKVNKNPVNRFDPNCEYGVKDTKELP